MVKKNNGKSYCPNCDDVVNYKVVDAIKTSVLRGEIYKHSGKRAQCAVCGAKVWDTEVNKYNLEQLRKALGKEDEEWKLVT